MSWLDEDIYDENDPFFINHQIHWHNKLRNSKYYLIYDTNNIYKDISSTIENKKIYKESNNILIKSIYLISIAIILYLTIIILNYLNIRKKLYCLYILFFIQFMFLAS